MLVRLAPRDLALAHHAGPRMKFQVPAATAASDRRQRDRGADGHQRPLAPAEGRLARPGAWPGPPNPRASIAVASFDPRRIDSTSSANAMPEEPPHAAAVGDPPRPAGELERPPVVEEQPDHAQPGERAEHEARAGSRSTCASPSARSVGSTVTNSTTEGSAIASTRKKVASASSSDPSLTRTKNHST